MNLIGIFKKLKQKILYRFFPIYKICASCGKQINYYGEDYYTDHFVYYCMDCFEYHTATINEPFIIIGE